MALPNDPASSDPRKNIPPHPKSSQDIEGVVDELRNVLSDLGNAKPTNPLLPTNSLPPANPLFSPDMTNADLEMPGPDIAANDDESKLLGEAAFNQAAQSEPTSSDADFWSGNVLGWPKSPEEEAASASHETFNGSGQEEMTALPSEAETQSLESGGFASGEPGVESRPFSWMGDRTGVVKGDESLGEDEGDNNQPPVFDSPPVPTNNLESRSRPESLSSASPPAADSGERYSYETINNLFPAAPEPPVAPTEKKNGTSKPISRERSKPDLESAFSALSGDYDADLRPSGAKPKQQDATPMEEFPVPIPQTIQNKQPPARETPLEVTLKVNELKPQGLVQIACVFPAGQEKVGQMFVSKLQDAGAKSRIPLNIQPVFIQPWSNDTNVASWEKSSSLSGADFMFVLVAKKDVAKFPSLLKRVDKAPMQTRLILLEQIGLRTLYAELLVQLDRTIHGQG